MSFTEPVHILLHLASFSLMVSLAVSGFMIAAGLLDKPVDRSNHSAAVPTAGGVGIIAGCGAGLLALAIFYPLIANQPMLGALIAIMMGVGFMGLIDDIYVIPSSLKFVLMVGLSTVAVMTIGPPSALPFSMLEIPLPYWLAFSGSVLWVFVMTNGVNFMDGANGLMGAFMLIAFAFLAFISVLANAMSTAILSAIMVAGIAGFLPYNWLNRAHIFAGDVGALFVGFAYAICVLLLIKETGANGLLYVGPLLVLPFLTDILLTMLVRLRRKEDLMSPHSSHIYQRLIRSGRSHSLVTFLYVCAALMAGASVLVGVKTGMIRSLFYLSFATSLWVMLYLLLHRKYPNESGPQQTQPNP